MDKKSTLQVITNLKNQDMSSSTGCVSPTERDSLRPPLSSIVINIKENDDTSCNLPKDRNLLPDNSDIQTDKISQEEPIKVDDVKLSNQRLYFIRKVLATLFLQLTITIVAIILTFIPGIGVRDFMSKTLLAPIIIGIVGLICLILLLCVRNVCRKKPCNYMLLLTFTFSLSYILGTVAAVTESHVVIICWIRNNYNCCRYCDVCLLSQKIVPQSIEWHLTCLTTAAMLILISALAIRSEVINLVSSILIGCFFGLHLAYDMQKLAGKYETRYSLDDYILASLEIYIDVVQIFSVILGFLKRSN